MTLRISTGLRDHINGINTELVTDGTMTTDVLTQAAWTESAATMLGGVSFDSAAVMSLTGADGYASQTVTVNPSMLYQFSYKWGKTGTTDSAEVKLGTAADNAAYYEDAGHGTAAQATLATVGAAATESDSIIIKTGAAITSIVITLGIDGATDIAYFDDVSLKCLSRSIQDVFNLSQIEIYTGTQPSTADKAPTGTKLVTINNGGTGCTFDDSASGVLTKTSTETWSGVAAATGTAGWARLLLSTDDDSLSTTEPRIDMSVGTSGAQINFSSTSFASGATQTISSFSLTMPAS